MNFGQSQKKIKTQTNSNQYNLVGGSTVSSTTYSMKTDKTLSKDQRLNGRFTDHQTLADKSSGKDKFRISSQSAKGGEGFSGYHEAGLTTDTVNELQGRMPTGKPGISVFPNLPTKPIFSNREFREANIAPVLAAGDGARMDTFQTVLSSTGRRAAGHSGSGFASSGQSAAHDIARKLTMRLLKSKYTTGNVAAATYSAFMAASMAPAETINATGAKALKEGPEVEKEWEARRGEMKARASHLFEQLSPVERRIVRGHMKFAYRKMNRGRRKLEKDNKLDASWQAPPRRQLGEIKVGQKMELGAVSPKRSFGQENGNRFFGGGYLKPFQSIGQPSLTFPIANGPTAATSFTSAPSRRSRSKSSDTGQNKPSNSAQ